jgi:hypothetical protein
MKKLFKSAWCGGALSATAVALCLQSGTVLAQESASGDEQKAIVTGDELLDRWQYELTAYGWLKSIDGTVSDHGLELDFKEDLLDMLDGAFSLRFEAERSIVSLFAAYEYTKIGDDVNVDGSITVQPPVGPPVNVGLNGKADASNTQQRVELGAGYTLHRSDAMKWQLIGGAKWFDDEVEIKQIRVAGPGGNPLPGNLPSKLKDENDFWQGFLGGRFTARLSDSWRMRGRLDYGYGGSDSDSWTAELTADWRFTHWGALQFGYRYMDIDYVDDDYSFIMEEHGPIIGFIANW